MKWMIILFFLIWNSVLGQGISADYDCTVTYPNGIALNYTGKFFYQDNKSISYMLPDYLSKYPEGTVEQKGINYGFSTDSVQFILLMNLDSGTYKATINPTIYEGKLDATDGEWQITNEVTTIEGYKCQHAYWVRKNSKDTATEIWYTDEISCPTGFEVWNYVPGFVVKVKTPMNMVATLRKVRVGDAIAPEVFVRKELKKKK